MATSEELFMAILSMDTYNRGYHEGIEGLGGIGTSIGYAIIKAQSIIDSASYEVNSGFYAAAYDWNDQTVISYRGTDAILSTAWNDGTEMGGDLSNAYFTGGGDPLTVQAVPAAELGAICA